MRIADPWVRSDRSDHCPTTTASSKQSLSCTPRKSPKITLLGCQKKNKQVKPAKMKIFSNILLIKTNTKAAFSCRRQRLKIYFLAIRQNYKNSFFASTESRALLSPNFLENVNKLISLKPNIVSRTFCRKTMNGSSFCFQMIFLNKSWKCNKAEWVEKRLLKRIQCELL